MQRPISHDEIRELLQLCRPWILEEASMSISAEMIRLAVKNGLVFFEEREESHEVPCESDYFGFRMTYGEYWAIYPEERPVSPKDSVEVRVATYLLLKFDSRFLVLRSSLQSDRILHARTIRDPDRSKPISALLLVTRNGVEPEENLHWDVQEPKPILSEGIGSGWKLSDSCSIQTLESPEGSIRYWDWGWQSTHGPAILTVCVQKSRDELVSWLHGLRSQSFVDQGDTLVPVQELENDLLDHYIEIEAGKFRFKMVEGLGIDLYLADGVVQWLHGTSFKPGQPIVDSMLLHSIRQGALGDVKKWTLVDGDYGTLCMAGRGIDSLRDYLDPKQSEGSIRKKLSRYYPSVSPKQVDSLNMVLEEILGKLGIAVREGRTPHDQLETWIMDSEESELPVELAIVWNLSISAPDQVRDFFAAWNARQGRMSFRMHGGYWKA